MHVYRMVEFTLQECIFYIQLMNRSCFRESNAEYYTDGDWFNNWTESLSAIYANLLTCTVTYKLGFMPPKEPSDFSLCLKIHIEQITFASGGRGTKSYVLF